MIKKIFEKLLSTLRWLGSFYKGNPQAIIGSVIVGGIMLACVFANTLATHDPNKRVARGHQPPSAELVMGSTRSGKDIYSQLLHGGRVSLGVAFGAALIAVGISISVGVSAGYFGGRIDDALMWLCNVALVIPQLPLLITLSALLGQVPPWAIATLIGVTSWAWGARVLRSQTMSIRNKEFILAAEVMGESKWRIIVVEILPNMISIVVGMFVGTCMYALGAEAGLGLLGLSDTTIVTWGTMLYWAQANAAFFVGAWWDMIFPGSAVALLTLGFALINMSVDQVSNPKLRTGGFLKRWKRMNKEVEAKRALSVSARRADV